MARATCTAPTCFVMCSTAPCCACCGCNCTLLCLPCLLCVLRSEITPEELAEGRVYPNMHKIRDISLTVALETLKAAAEEGHLHNEHAVGAATLLRVITQ